VVDIGGVGGLEKGREGKGREGKIDEVVRWRVMGSMDWGCWRWSVLEWEVRRWVRGGGMICNRLSQATSCYSPPRAMACLPFVGMLTVSFR
jgi:hypothetical protein